MIKLIPILKEFLTVISGEKFLIELKAKED